MEDLKIKKPRENKVMTQEDKAKRYDEALHKAKRIINVCVDDNTECRSMIACIQELFPELKEESEGERIRKALIKYYSFDKDGGSHALDNITPKQILVWLEKQGEQKPEGKTALKAIKEEKVDNTNKVEPKFKVGDWVVLSTSDGEKIVQIDSIEYFINGEPRYITSEGKWFGNATKAHLWTIQDVKDGDVLVTRKSQPFIFKKYDEDTDYVYAYCGICDLVKDNSFYTDDDQLWTCYSVAGDVYPATKEQRDLLFQKMKEAGYKWDAEKKELKEIEQKPVIEMKTPEESLGIDSDTYNKIVDECIYGEQKPADVEEVNFFEDFRKTDSEVEPKFKVEKDKWYVCISQYCNCIEGRNYKASLDGRIIDDYGTEYDMHDDAYRWFRPWTIQDAKDGDVLEFGDHGRLVVGIVSYVNKTTGKVDVNCLLENNDFKVGNYYNLDTIKPHPVTKEQHDTLMKAMTDAGYTFDFEKKELKKIEQSPVDVITTGYCHVKDVEQNSAWSEKDDEIIEEIINDIECARAINYHAPKEGYEFRENWLESIKDRVQPQPQQKWSKEDETKIKSIIALLKSPTLCTMDGNKGIIDESIKYLKSIKYRVQSKQEWSEEDEAWLNDIICDAEQEVLLDTEQIKYLKSLKNRVQPKQEWKPSNEQLNNILDVLSFDNCTPKRRELLESLYHDLKKLVNEK